MYNCMYTCICIRSLYAVYIYIYIQSFFIYIYINTHKYFISNTSTIYAKHVCMIFQCYTRLHPPTPIVLASGVRSDHVDLICDPSKVTG